MQQPVKGGLMAASAFAERDARPSSVLILGLGNPILGDDGVGWRVAEALRGILADQPDSPEVDCAALGGLSLMERMLGYERVVLVDSVCTGVRPVGAVEHHALQDLPNPGGGHTASAHDTSLATALRTAEALGAQVTGRVDVVTIETAVCYDFSESLSPVVEAAVPVATRTVLGLVRAREASTDNA
jgi:hydrogenase maturation protease